LQAFATSNLPIRKLDFSNNAIRRLPDKAFAGIQVYLWFTFSIFVAKLNNNHIGQQQTTFYHTMMCVVFQ
jgi:hypothetical protein